jgi:hypothetical protein
MRVQLVESLRSSTFIIYTGYSNVGYSKGYAHITIFKRDQCINLARPTIDDTMTPDGITAMRESIILRSLLISQCTMLPGLVDDTLLHLGPHARNMRRLAHSHQAVHTSVQLMNGSKDDAPQGGNNAYVAIIRSRRPP